MPRTRIAQIGDVDYLSVRLPEGIKGKAMIGDLTAPIQISEDLGPGAKLDYVLAHEIGHRLTLDMILNAYEESPSFFEFSPSPTAGFIRYLIHLGLQENQLHPVHPGTIAQLKEIFAQNFRGEYTPDDIAIEFIAEVYAQWATGKGSIPEPIARRFRMLTKSKNELLTVKRDQEAAFEEFNIGGREYNAAVLGAIGLIVMYIVLKEI
ncbi:hypothetical protein [Nocardioides sp.]|uniref:hypothetical protein n=1 Tax=Nocardioides sp. TaxID=35761 RepID=UPI002737157F|nr:hypothetical protein [Nocardioides sp.]MDP3893904.1 hypothetical protein [Nocardioides sp.]